MGLAPGALTTSLSVAEPPRLTVSREALVLLTVMLDEAQAVRCRSNETALVRRHRDGVGQMKLDEAQAVRLLEQGPGELAGNADRVGPRGQWGEERAHRD